jgi:hypothetical protein
VEDTEEFEEQLEEGLDQVPPEDLAEYLALVHSEDILPMNFVDLDIADKKTSAGKEGDAVSTQRVNKRINAKYSLFLADLDDSELDLCSDIYLPGKADFVNRMLVRQFIHWYISHTSPTVSHISESLMFLQRKLSDAMNDVGEIPRKGMIREDTWIKDFTKDMLVKTSDPSSSTHSNLHSNLATMVLDPSSAVFTKAPPAHPNGTGIQATTMGVIYNRLSALPNGTYECWVNFVDKGGIG